MLVMLGDDLGTTFILLVIFLALLWVIGTPGRLFVGMLGLMGFAMVILIIVAPLPAGPDHRVPAPAGASPDGSASRRIQGKYAVGSGGWFGVGLGARQDEVGLGARTPPPTSSSRSSARNSAWSARCA